MNIVRYIMVLFTLMIFTSCSNSDNKKAQAEVPNDKALVPQSWITERVEAAKNNLNKTDAGKLVWRAMEAHGGLHTWYSNGAIDFQFDYQPIGKGARRNTKQLVDTWSNKVVHEDIKTPSAKFGWNGKDAWVTTKDTSTFDYNLRFWAITPIYFLAEPFNFDGQGVQLEKLVDKKLNGKMHDAVKISFEDGTGDASGDYYINYYDKNSHQLQAIRYIVSYPKYFKDGGHSPEKIMTLHDFTAVNGITLPTAYKTYKLTEDEDLGEHVTNIKVSNINFRPDTKNDAFEMTDDAHVILGL